MYNDGKGVPQSYAKALRWWQKAADQGHTEAQYNLGGMYVNGRGVTQSDMAAVHWFRKAADTGLAEAQHSLGSMYMKGQGVTQSVVEAARWSRKAADQGHPAGQWLLGTILFFGEEVPRDLGTSHKYLVLAAAQGFKEAQKAVRAFFPEGAPLTNAISPLYAAAGVPPAAACAHCGITSVDLKVCPRCRTAAYCGRECQASNWKAGHKEECNKQQRKEDSTTFRA
jgi:TPR repeat protein